LAEGQESISAIAEMTGFDTTQYFSYVYKKQMGVTPSEYKLSLHAKKESDH
jgi:AraC-like DNA-binding protein